jgi:hypothetical protein
MIEKKQKPDTFSVGGIDIPYYHFIYKGDFYKYLRIRNNKLLGNGMRINEYFQKRAYEHYNFKSNELVFNKGLMIIIHYFRDLGKRDLDNNSYKPLIDGIKKTGIIKDDSWQDLSLMFIGAMVEENDESEERIETFVVPHEYSREFLFSDTINPNIFLSRKLDTNVQDYLVELAEEVKWVW